MLTCVCILFCSCLIANHHMNMIMLIQTVDMLILFICRYLSEIKILMSKLCWKKHEIDPLAT
jgi:hypothetical protein